MRAGRCATEIKNGTAMIVEVEDQPVVYQGDTCRLLSVVEVTERPGIEQRLREEQEQMQDLLENLPGAVFRADAEGRIQYAGGDWNGLTGRAPQDVQGTTLTELVHTDDCSRLAEGAEALSPRYRDRRYGRAGGYARGGRR
jgi:PAS domain S-box-containing protein